MQFQTSAVRYQLNFMSYALSITQARHMPAFTGYLAQAQQNLILKQQDYRIWRYWQLENMWGNFRRLPDPIPHQNIMFTGFLAAQIAFYQAASGSTAHNAPGSLAFRHPSGDRYSYDLPGLVDVLMRGHRQSAFGLIACEPNWIYPLCNAIGTAAIRAYDGTSGTAHWAEIEAAFGHRLETEFISPRGRLVPARSSSTGLAVPPIGGAVMQAFPCLFLNATLPDIAERQWLLVRRRLERVGFRRALWPIDVGNYRFSRASSFAATAAAAVELGDNDMAKRLLDGLDEACPMHVTAGVAHRANASLWAHAVEMMARAGAADALRSLASGRRQAAPGPFVKVAAYPDVLVARAFARNGALDAVLYPGRAPGVHALTIAGLSPGQAYRSNLEPDSTIITAIIADRHGDTTIRVPLAGRTVWQLRPVAL